MENRTALWHEQRMQELSLHSVVMGTVLHWKRRLDLDEACMALDDLYRNADTVVMIE